MSNQSTKVVTGKPWDVQESLGSGKGIEPLISRMRGHLCGVGTQLRFKRFERGLHHKTVGILLGGASQTLINWWESGRYVPSPRYLPKLNQSIVFELLAVLVFAGLA